MRGGSSGDGSSSEDKCKFDPFKLVPGVCGCGIRETDRDGDGVPDCADQCPDDPAKSRIGVCGCGVADSDADGDLAPDCVDRCPADPGKAELGICGCHVPDVDRDGDGIMDCHEASWAFRVASSLVKSASHRPSLTAPRNVACHTSHKILSSEPGELQA